ncbi:MAG: hypothetical protein L3V56_07170 [Candidatus Magnetoovum sp. WYHC-5]|nr:hypothetical protein [Candidatus Magnetoovum sp. WYHC-5]
MDVAISVIIVGIMIVLILKGYAIVEYTREQDLYSKVIKIKTAILLFYSKNGRLPGDGCKDNPINGVSTVCSTDIMLLNGVLETPKEQKAFWSELIRNNFITKRDTMNNLNKTPFLVTSFWSKKTNQPSIYIETAPTAARAICRLDKKYDDGISKNLSGVQIFTANGNEYYKGTVCENLQNDIIGRFIVY